MASSSRPSVVRGDVWIVDLNPIVGSEQAKTRPCVVVQRDVANRSSHTTIVVPITDAAGRVPSIVRPVIDSGDGGLTKASAALCDQVRTVDRRRFRRRLGRIAPQTLERIGIGLYEIMDLGQARDE